MLMYVSKFKGKYDFGCLRPSIKSYTNNRKPHSILLMITKKCITLAIESSQQHAENNARKSTKREWTDPRMKEVMRIVDASLDVCGPYNDGLGRGCDSGA